MEIDFEKMAQEYLDGLNDYAAEKFQQDYKAYSEPDGATDGALHLACISTAVAIASKLTVSMMERYHEELMKQLAK